MDSLSLLQGIFPTQELNWGFLHCRQILYQPSYQASPWSWIRHELKAWPPVPMASPCTRAFIRRNCWVWDHLLISSIGQSFTFQVPSAAFSWVWGVLCFWRTLVPSEHNWEFLRTFGISNSTHIYWAPNNSLEKTLMLGKMEGERRNGWQRMRRLGSIMTHWTWVWANYGR